MVSEKESIFKWDGVEELEQARASVSGVFAWLTELSCLIAGVGVLEVVWVSLRAMTMP